MTAAINQKQIIKMLNTIEALIKFYSMSEPSKIQNLSISIKDDDDNVLIITSLYSTDDVDDGDNGCMYIAYNPITGESIRDFLGSLASEDIINLYNFFK